MCDQIGFLFLINLINPVTQSTIIQASPSRPRTGWLILTPLILLLLIPYPSQFNRYFIHLCSYSWGSRCPLHQQSCRSLPFSPKNGLVNPYPSHPASSNPVSFSVQSLLHSPCPCRPFRPHRDCPTREGSYHQTGA